MLLGSGIYNSLMFPDFRYQWYIFLLSKISSLRMVALCNSRATGEANENSDIDLFIIAQSGKIWTTRFWATFWASILGIRRRSTHGLLK